MDSQSQRVSTTNHSSQKNDSSTLQSQEQREPTSRNSSVNYNGIISTISSELYTPDYNGNYISCVSHFLIPDVVKYITFGGTLSGENLTELGSYLEEEIFIKTHRTPKYVIINNDNPLSRKRNTIKMIAYTVNEYLNLIKYISMWLSIKNNKDLLIYYH